jgi:drug/metabolite transporter (DMT)-like permease
MKRVDIGLLLALAAIWGASFMFIKIILKDMSPLTLVGLRMGLGALGLAAFVAGDALVARQRGIVRPPFAWRRLIVPGQVLAIINVVVPYVGISWGETYISSGDAAILNATTPLWTTLIIAGLGQRVSRETADVTKVVGVLVGFVGVVVLVAGGESQVGVTPLNNWLGHGAVLLAALSYGLSGLYARRATAGIPPAYNALAQAVFAALIMAVPAALNPPHAVSPETIGALLALGLGGTALALLIYFQLIARVGTTRTVIVTYLLPVTALIYGALLLGEPIHAQAILGLVLVLLGIAVAGGLLRRRAWSRQQPG